MLRFLSSNWCIHCPIKLLQIFAGLWDIDWDQQFSLQPSQIGMAYWKKILFFLHPSHLIFPLTHPQSHQQNFQRIWPIMGVDKQYFRHGLAWTSFAIFSISKCVRLFIQNSIVFPGNCSYCNFPQNFTKKYTNRPWAMLGDTSCCCAG